MSKINGTQSEGHSNHNRSTLSTGEYVYVTDYLHVTQGQRVTNTNSFIVLCRHLKQNMAHRWND